MGVRASLAAITLTGGDIAQAELLGIDAKALLSQAQLKCQEVTQILNLLITDVLTPASDAGNITAFGTQITALA